MKAIQKAAILLSLILIAGCSMQNSPVKKPQPEQQLILDEKQIQVNQEMAEKAKEVAQTIDEVKESTAVAINEDVSIGIKVTGFDRLRLKPIRSEVHQRIKAIDQSYNIHVTSDKKHISQLKEMEKELNKQDKSLQDIHDKFNKIKRETQK